MCFFKKSLGRWALIFGLELLLWIGLWWDFTVLTGLMGFWPRLHQLLPTPMFGFPKYRSNFPAIKWSTLQAISIFQLFCE